MLQNLYNWTLAWAAAPQAEWALFLIALSESSFFPLPPDLLMIPMAAARPERAFIFALICLVGSILGALFGYWLGKYGGQPLLFRFFRRERVEKVESLFNRYDAWAIGIAGFSPVPYKIFTIASGAFNVSLKTFILVSILSRGGRFFLVASLFYFFGPEMKHFLENYLNWITLGMVAILALTYLLWRWKGKSWFHKDNADNLGDSNSPVLADTSQSKP